MQRRARFRGAIAVGGLGVASMFAVPSSVALVPPVTDDCTVDVSAELNTWLAALPDGSAVDFGTGCYLAEQTLQVNGKTGITFTGGTFRALTTGAHLPPWDGKPASWPRHRAHWRIASSTGITFTGTRVEGPNTGYVYDSALEAQHGFAVSGSTGVNLTDIIVRNVYGDFVTVADGSSLVTVTRLDGSGAGRQGMAVTNATDVTLQDSTLDRVRRSGVDIEPWNIEQVHRVRILRNLFTEFGNTTVGVGGSGQTTDVTVTGNRSLLPWYSKFQGQGRTGLTFVANVSDAAPTYRPLVTVTAWSGLTFRGNIMPVLPLTPVKGGTRGGYWLDMVSPVSAATIDGVRIS